MLLAAACNAPQQSLAPAVDSGPVEPVNTLVGVGSHGNPNEAAQVASLHMGHTRLTYYTKDDTPQYRAEFAARLLDFRSRNIEPLVVVHDFVNRADAPNWMELLATIFPGTLWQVGNEWDAVPVGYGKGGAYAELMKAVTLRVRNADADARIVGMGLATTDGQSWSVQGDVPRVVQFTRDYLNAGGPVLEAWCIHAYGMTLDLAVSKRVDATRGVLAGAMPIWVTEVGADREGIQKAWPLNKTVPWNRESIDAVQARESVNAITAARAHGVARLYFYQLWTGDDDGFGFLRSDAVTERPIMNALRRELWQN